MMKFVGHRIADVNLNRLITRFLKAGIIDAGIKYDTPKGTPQGGVCSPILGNIYLHYAIDIWFEKIVRKQCKGKAYMVRYADDSIFCFQYEEDARKFYRSLIERLKKFKLNVAEEKTKILELKKNEEDEDKGDNSFDFLGFTHYVGKNKFGRKQVMRKTSKKKYKASLLKCKEWMKNNRTLPVDEFMKTMKAKIQGHCNYYGVTGNRRMIGNFIDECRSFIYKWLNRRSQKKSFNWDKYVLFLKMYPLPKVKINVYIYEPGAGNSYYCK